MKKVYVLLLAIMLTCTSLPAYAHTYDNNRSITVSQSLQVRPINPLAEKSQNIYIGVPYNENSTDGYTIKTDSNGQKYKFRIRHIKRTHTDLELYQSQYIFSLYNGQTKSVTENYTSTRSSSVTWSVNTQASASFNIAKVGVKASVSTTLTNNNAQSSSYSITKGTVYSFPNNAPPEAMYCNLYAGFCHDVYEVVSDYVPYKTVEKKTKVTSISVTTPPPDPDEDPFKMGEFDIRVRLADGRVLTYFVTCPPHHNDPDYNQVPEVRAVLSQFDDGYYYEYSSGYDYSSREVFTGTLRRPIPYEQFVYVY